MNYPRVAAFTEIQVHPYYQLFAPTILDLRGGPCWPNFDERTFERHQRFGRVVDLEVAVNPTPLPRLTGRYVWLGPVLGHFGHQIFDFSMRAAISSKLRPGARFLIAGQAPDANPLSVPSGNNWRYPDLASVPKFVKEILAWYGIAADQLTLVVDPVSVDEIEVFEQGEQFGVAPTDWHLDALDQCAARIEPLCGGPVYVSRTMLSSPLGNVMGERAIESAFDKAGFQIIHPELLSVTEQARVYAGASQLVFSEGSALHGLALLGRIEAPVVVIDRRMQGDALTFECSVAPRVPSYSHLQAIAASYPDDANWRSVAVLDPEKLISQFSNIGIDLGEFLDPRVYWRSASSDLDQVCAVVLERPFAFGHDHESQIRTLVETMRNHAAIMRRKSESGVR